LKPLAPLPIEGRALLDPEYHEERGREWRLQTDGSRLLERCLEYQFLGLLTAELLRRGLRYEVLRGDIDLDGHDVVVEVGGVIRHIQLKGFVAGGRAREVDVNIGLAAKPSGCVIRMTYDPATLQITDWRWFGDAVGRSLPPLGSRFSTHTRNGKPRPNIRVLGISRFTRVASIAELTDRLFGRADLALLRRHMRAIAAPGEGWLAQVQAGDFAAMPHDLDWDSSVELAHLIDGYALAEQLRLGDATEYAQRQLETAQQSGVWAGDAVELWITLFLEHRRWRFSSPIDPNPDMETLLDGLVRQLLQALTGEMN
jgi:hypothetical protein